MRIAGIIAEYNPFHNGHRLHIERTREAGATHIVCIMSGAAVQRGDIAVFDKHERAACAVRNGADLVIELPAPFSCMSGERFATAGVKLMAGLGEGAVELLSFGSECGDIEELKKAADISEGLESSHEVKSLISSGLSYPAAVSRAAGGGEVFSSPNGLLAVEYIKALRRYAPWAEPLAVERRGARHDSSETDGEIASASMLREKLRLGEDISAFLPESFEGERYFLKNADRVILYAVMSADMERLMRLPDMNEGLAKRFLSVRDGVSSAEEFALRLKNKSVTLARVRRTLMHLVLGITQDMPEAPEYGRILALNDRGREILAGCKNRTLCFDTSLARLERLSENAKKIAAAENRAAALQQLCAAETKPMRNEYSRKIELI
ncbi:MAG: nucleotidyltransferase family protein [Ruminococcus sp.]|nr:nucleotidyltransferase family protein [Ruminococcus sp.]